ncbi:MAG: hypothetical protein WA172_19125 [Terriglobales bacterium]
MSAETRKILEMLAEKKITAEEADKLLEKLSSPASAEAKPEEPSAAKPRFMRIVVDRPGQDQINVRMPLALMGTGNRILAVLPPRVNEKLAELGIDLSAASAMDPKDWASTLENMNIDIEKGSGKKVKIFCE